MDILELKIGGMSLRTLRGPSDEGAGRNSRGSREYSSVGHATVSYDPAIVIPRT